MILLRFTAFFAVIFLVAGSRSFSEAVAEGVAEVGVSEGKIVLGTSGPLTGGGAARYVDELRGSELAIGELNAAGGIHGRKIELRKTDDAYDPVKATENVNKLIAQDPVFAFFDIYGSAGLKTVVPILTKNKIPLLTPFAVAVFLHQPVIPNVFNLRVNPETQIEKMIDFLVGRKKLTSIGVFYQDDAFGQTGVASSIVALKKFNMHLKVSASYPRNTLDVEKAVRALNAAKVDGVLIMSQPPVAVELVKKLSIAGLKPVFIGNEGSWSETAHAEIKSAGSEYYVMTSVPTLASDSPMKKRYVAAANAAHQKPNDLGYEGYINGVFLGKMLLDTGKNLTREKFIETLDHANIDLDGLKVKLSPQHHSGFTTTHLYESVKGVLSEVSSITP